jgi:hypothetical protein
MKLTFLTHDLYNSLIRQGFTTLAFRNKQSDPSTGTIITYEALTPEEADEKNAIVLNKSNIERMLQQPNHIYYVIVKSKAGRSEAAFSQASAMMG